MTELPLKVTIAGRTYPLTIKAEEQQDVLEAERLINDKIREYESSYSIRDKQDLLAMCLLHFVTQNIQALKKEKGADEIADRLTKIDTFISNYLPGGL